MRLITHSRKGARTFAAALFAALLTLAPSGVAAASAPASPAGPAPSATLAESGPAAECGDTSEFDEVDLSKLPTEASDTVDLIQQDGPFPYPQDGTTFENREGILPDCADGYYKEYTVEDPNEDDRGARRFVVGEDDEYFYTDDHYESFQLTDIAA